MEEAPSNCGTFSCAFPHFLLLSGSSGYAKTLLRSELPRNAAYTCMMLVIDDIRPKITVNKKMTMAIQNVAHSGLLRRSYHHCWRAPGRATSYICCTSAKREPQMGYWARSSGGDEVSMPASRSLGPRLAILRFRLSFLRLFG